MDKLNKLKLSGLAHFHDGAAIGTLVVVLLLPLSLSMDDGEVVKNINGVGGSSGGFCLFLC